MRIDNYRFTCVHSIRTCCFFSPKTPLYVPSQLRSTRHVFSFFSEPFDKTTWSEPILVFNHWTRFPPKEITRSWFKESSPHESIDFLPHLPFGQLKPLPHRKIGFQHPGNAELWWCICRCFCCFCGVESTWSSLKTCTWIKQKHMCERIRASTHF